MHFLNAYFLISQLKSVSLSYRRANSVYVDIMAVMNQSATVNVTIEALEKKVNSGWLSDELNVDSGYFVVSPGSKPFLKLKTSV